MFFIAKTYIKNLDFGEVSNRVLFNDLQSVERFTPWRGRSSRKFALIIDFDDESWLY